MGGRMRRGRKEGRKEGREGRREEGREGGRRLIQELHSADWTWVEGMGVL